MRKPNLWQATALILIVASLFLCVGTVGLVTGMMLVPQQADTPLGVKSASAAPMAPAITTPQAPQPDVPLAADQEELLLESIYRRASASVVHIRVGQSTSSSAPPTPYGQEFPRQGEGSGFVWDTAGHILTNYHVVENAGKIEVEFFDGTTVRAQLIGGDADADLAVIKVEADASRLHPVRMGDSDQLFVGQRAIAIGNPFGQEWTMTTGIVSALGRTMPSGNSPYSIPEMIQTDAAINPGNSGGPLLNAQGEVIGVTTMIMSGSRSSAGVGFAVPVNIVRLVVPALIEEGQYVYSWLGMQGTELSLDLIESTNLPSDIRGVLVVSVVQGGPCEQAGLRGSQNTVVVDGAQLAVGGDVITAIDGRQATSMEDIIVYLVKETRPGDQVTLTILRDNVEQTLVVNLAERPHTMQP